MFLFELRIMSKIQKFDQKFRDYKKSGKLLTQLVSIYMYM